ncbi:YqcC family protein [Enterobacillus tribolii]|uniref:Uncharacterized protein YqcC (DUF446 family) n=1 Tax=Enterobacillus tribolii TaxID=1487935 RepID=A0A370QPZ6_9GAMM|nr:YqcC family protein [Enterobacillus tribolii]MBW7981400.1 YqcC family protein [Enterobacillus tribolii]RDK90775.1 uncharacterized protein YqcC (DUF446 family) [Enterobacillus tribolii]
MSTHIQIRQLLREIADRMQALGLWQDAPPQAEAFSSVEPFCIDTMSAEQWLQWVFLPKMHDLLDSQAALPQGFAIYPYFELAFAQRHEELQPLMVTLLALDNLFASAKN